MVKELFGKLFGDKGYISFFDLLFADDVQLVTKIKKNMKNKLMDVFDKSSKRAIIDPIYDQLKNISQIEHTRHRSLSAFGTGRWLQFPGQYHLRILSIHLSRKKAIAESPGRRIE